MDLLGFSNRQIMAEVDAICNNREEAVYPDDRRLLLQLVLPTPGRTCRAPTGSVPANVKIIRVPCSCRVNPMFILRAFQRAPTA